MERQIRPEQARMGMYVRRFGGSWFGHPFWRARFVLESPAQVERVRQSGLDFLIIDEALGVGVDDPPEPAAASARGPAGRTVAPRARPTSMCAGAGEPRGTSREESDRQRARALVTRSKKIMRKTYGQARLGRAVCIAEVAPIVADVIEHVDRNPHALLNVLRLKKKSEYTYLHSVAVCTLMVNTALHMDKSRAETRQYGLAGLLHDVGKMSIPDSILDKAGPLTDEEYGKVRNHPEYGHAILLQSPEVGEMALDVCRHHHERIDGSGYPAGLRGEEISPVARLGAICDVYDALTSNRIYKDAWTPVQAIAAMWSWEGHFDRGLLFTFMQSLGVFAPDMLVLLRSNRLALVLEPRRPDQPTRALAFFATRERDWVEPEEIVFGQRLANDSIVGVADPHDWDLGDHDDLVERLKHCAGIAAQERPCPADRPPTA